MCVDDEGIFLSNVLILFLIGWVILFDRAAPGVAGGKLIVLSWILSFYSGPTQPAFSNQFSD